MSSIEQAAKRLQELENAGFGLREGPGNASESRPDSLPTPEAVIRALGRSAAPTGLSPAPAGVPPGPSVATSATAVVTPAYSSPERAEQPGQPSTPLEVSGKAKRVPTPRRLDIDLAMLRARGFVSPEAPTQLADEYRVLKRPVIHNATGRSGVAVKSGNLVMVTSALPGEGKTFTAVNLAMSIALEYDNTVLLVDGDVAHPQLPDLLGVPRSPGLLDLLTRDDIEIGDTLLRTNVAKLTIMAAGSRHPRATELLASEQMAVLLRELGSRYSDRIIIFDSPPLLATTEARVMASHMGQILMVVAANSTTQHAVQAALATIEHCDIVLMMLNKAGRTDVGTYYGYYGDAEKKG